MEVVSDFSRSHEWIYQCKETKVIALVGYSEAYIYQINALPLIKDRDIILHGRINPSDDGNEVRINLSAAPTYCDNNDDEDCQKLVRSPYVRVTQAEGEFILSKIDSNKTTITWQQFLDPGGAIPHWLFRAMLPQVPIQSLQNLKRLVENSQ